MLQSEALVYDDFQHLTVQLETPVNSDMAGFSFKFRSSNFIHFTTAIGVPPGESQLYRFEICPPGDAFVPETGLFARRDPKQFADGSRLVGHVCASDGGLGFWAVAVAVIVRCGCKR